MDHEIDREAYRRGVAALKNRIKELAARQKAWKAALRMPRKDANDRMHLQWAIDKILPPDPKRYGSPHYDVTYVQSWAAARKIKISAYLNVYAQVRGKAPCHTPREGWQYELPRHMNRAREEFNKACGTTLVKS